MSFDLTINAPEDAAARSITKLTAEDGVVGALCGDSFITSLIHSESLPAPPSNSAVQLMEDGRLGEHDFTLWPQYYQDALPHYAVIPLRPCLESEPEHPYKDHLCVWQNILDEDIEWDGGSPLSGVGALDHTLFVRFEEAVNFIVREANTYLENPTSSGFAAFVRLRIARLEAFRDRLRQPRSDLISIRVTVAGLQHIWLDLAAALRYMQVYQPILNGNAPVLPARLRIRVMGAFTDRVDVVEMFWLARVPIYLIRPITRFKGQIIFRECDVKNPPPFRVSVPTFGDIFVGSPTDASQWNAAYTFYARFLSYIHEPVSYLKTSLQPVYEQSSAVMADVAKFTAASTAGIATTAPPAVGPSRNLSSQSSKRRKVKHGGHPNLAKVNDSKPASAFQDLVGDFVPPAIPAWSAANFQVDVNSNRFASQRPIRHTYFFPPPSLFTNANPARRSDYFTQYSHLRDALVFRAQSPFTEDKDRRPQEWRNILALRRSKEESEKTTQAQMGFNSARDILGKCFSLQGVKLELVPPPHSDPPSVLQCQELFWELCELHFRSELFRLDAQLFSLKPPEGSCADDIQRLELEHSRLLTGIFPEDSLTTVEMDKAPLGLSSPEWCYRAVALERFRDVMANWSVPLPEMLQGQVPVVQDIFEHWEKALVQHYVQVFFDVFGRHAILPRTPATY